MAGNGMSAERVGEGLVLVPEISRWEGPEDPALAYFKIRRGGAPSFLLESAERPGESARYSIIGSDPLLHVMAIGSKLKVEGNAEVVRLSEKTAHPEKDMLRAVGRALMLGGVKVRGALNRYAVGAFGYIGYDYALTDPNVRVEKDPVPEIEFMVPGRIVLFDHVSGANVHLSLVPYVDGEKIETSPGSEVFSSSPEESREKPTAGVSISRKRFEEMVSAAKAYIRSGDIIQAVLSRRIDMTPPPPLRGFYLRLRRINPSPYMFLFEFPSRTIVGSSPEVLVKVNGRRVETRPIAGTRRLSGGRRRSLIEKELVADEKERAEHVMLVDLGRNDLGRVCRFGSVRVEEFMKIERYSHVVHLVSRVVGELRSDAAGLDALAVTFPAGTVTGAPKVRAMEIIDELEPSRRGVYAGAVGCLSYTGDLDMAITIRTMVVEGERASVQVGAGVVADSIPWKEYYETENKARALMEAAGCV
ncbi:MAG: anthranilate synthase component I family protein [Candidatus Hadarchaeales archaeon]